MKQDDKEDNTIYKIIVNDKGQFSLWPVDHSVPSGWKDGDKIGSRKDCMIYINLLHIKEDE